MKNNSNIGRQLFFIVKDNITGKYLGVICISGDFMDLGPRDKAIGWERNAKTFLDSGGTGSWVFIVFHHNEHQVEEARELSKRWGFDEFIIKKTSRKFETSFTRKFCTVCF